jgi:hypothetical protein
LPIVTPEGPAAWPLYSGWLLRSARTWPGTAKGRHWRKYLWLGVTPSFAPPRISRSFGRFLGAGRGLK